MYEILIDKGKALSFLEVIPIRDKERIMKKLEETSNDPLRFFKHLIYRNDYKLRIGKYRVIADIDHLEKKIKITKIRLRKNAYD